MPCGAINNIAEVFADPQVRERGMVTEWQHPLADDLQLVASPIRMGATPVRSERPPPLLGQHTSEVLTGVLGWSEARVAELQQQGVV